MVSESDVELEVPIATPAGPVGGESKLRIWRVVPEEDVDPVTLRLAELCELLEVPPPPDVLSRLEAAT